MPEVAISRLNPLSLFYCKQNSSSTDSILHYWNVTEVGDNLCIYSCCLLDVAEVWSSCVSVISFISVQMNR